MRENISSVKTKQQMANALEHLLETKPIEKITVSDITNICKINRQTFYYHFHDIHELTKWMFANYAQKLLGPEIAFENWHEAFLSAARFMQKKKNVLIGIVRSVGHYYLTDFLINTIKPYIRDLILNKTRDKNVPDKYSDFLSDYYTISFSGLLIEWLMTEADLTTTPEELLKLLNITVEGTVDNAINRYMKTSG